MKIPLKTSFVLQSLRGCFPYCTCFFFNFKVGILIPFTTPDNKFWAHCRFAPLPGQHRSRWSCQTDQNQDPVPPPGGQLRRHRWPLRGSLHRLVRQDRRRPKVLPREGDLHDAGHSQADPRRGLEARRRQRQETFGRWPRAEDHPEQERHFESGSRIQSRDFELELWFKMSCPQLLIIFQLKNYSLCLPVCW